MASYSKRVKIEPNVLLEYNFNTDNFKSEDYKILTNLKENTKSFLSTSTINNLENSLFMIDSVLNKYTPINTDNFNFLRIQNFFNPAINYDKITLYFPSGFDFYDDYLGFYINIYTLGFNNNNKYSLSNFYYIKSNPNQFKIFDLPVPFYYDEKFWVRSITFDIPSVNTVSNQRIISNIINEPNPDSLNKNLSYGEGLSTNSPIMIDFSYITSVQKIFNVPYYYLGDEYSCSIPQIPEYTELGVNVLESNQGDFFEIYATYLGSNENMDEFAYNQEIKGNKIQLDYVVNLYEENILTTTQTYQVTKDFTQKILFRPVIKFSNTTALIDVELKIVNLVDNSYTSKFGSLGITNSINKYGLKLTRLNLDSGVMNPNIYNLKIRNTMSVNGSLDSSMDVVKVPYPVLVDKYQILTKSSNAFGDINKYIPNGLLEILITSFDNIIQFNIAQDINSKGEPVPYNLAEISNNSKLMLVFKSDSEKLEIEPYYDANNNYEIGKISYKVQEKNYNILRRIYDKGYDNFYLVLNSSSTNTQLYSGKFLFYEDVTFLQSEPSGTTSGTTGTTIEQTTTINIIQEPVESKVDQNIIKNNQFIEFNMVDYEEDPTVNKNYFNAIVYVRSMVNIDKMNIYCSVNGLNPKIQYGNVFYFERVYITTLQDIKLQPFVEKVFELQLGAGMLPKLVKETNNQTINVVTKPTDELILVKPKVTKPVVSPPRPGGGSCFTPESLILMIDGTTKMIKDLIVGEQIKSYEIKELPLYENLNTWEINKLEGNSSISTINNILIHDITSGYYNINNNLLNVTGEHMILVFKNNMYKFISAEQLSIGDLLVDDNCKLIEINSKEFVNYSGKVYNLTLDSNYVYYVNNILVHNVKVISRNDVMIDNVRMDEIDRRRGYNEIN